jgi:hypothetical protein
MTTKEQATARAKATADPCGDDNKRTSNSKGNGKSRSRSPTGMTTKEQATTTATVRTTADLLWG